ncbi:MAG: single-stranded-DNA-specific exonuclease RecJ [Bacteroidetes bacterium]|nr:MAG: single-stranded-DNA-specific exonuclease RecJ [Bacteroidota bacterium]
MMIKRWKQKTGADEELVRKLASELGIHLLLARLLVLRGVKTFEEARIFFRPSLDQLHDPYLMRDMDKAVDRIEHAIENEEKILVYGDYDVDGTTAVALVYSFIKALGAECGFYIPDRYKEGYGISYAGIDFAAENKFGLIIALDCGIKAVEKVRYAGEKGIDFIICDHHRPGPELPPALAVLDPKRDDCTYPYDELTGCGIGFKLVQAYAQKRKIDFEKLLPLLDLVAVSIAADIVPVTGENRALMYAGLKEINTSPREGLKTLVRMAALKREFTVSDLVFTIAPRINAAGRIEHGKLAVELLTAPDEKTAEACAEKLNKNNADRKDLDMLITQQALDMMAADPLAAQRKSTVLFQPQWHKGVVGIVASRLIEKYYRPTIVLAEANGMVTGSARSVKDFDVYEAIEACNGLLEQFGGHKYAAGLTLKKENVEKFRERFEEEVSRRITPDMLTPEVEIDATLSLNDIDGKLLRILKQFAPFGPGNMNPVFLASDVRDRGWLRIVGVNHLKMDIVDPAQPTRIFPAIGFGLGDHYLALSQQKPFDMCYAIEENDFNGNVSVQLSIKDIKPL